MSRRRLWPIPPEGPCSGHECDGCKKCRTGHCCRRDQPSYKLPELGSWQPVHGQLGVRNEDGSRVECHACGGWFQVLGSHIWHAHDLSTREYRAAFGLNGAGLVSSDARASHVALGKRLFREGRIGHILGVPLPTPEQRLSHLPRGPETIGNITRAIRRYVRDNPDVVKARARKNMVRLQASQAHIPGHQRVAAAHAAIAAMTRAQRQRNAAHAGRAVSAETHRRAGTLGGQVRAQQMADPSVRAALIMVREENAEYVEARAARLRAQQAINARGSRRPHPCPRCGKIVPRSAPKFCSRICANADRSDRMKAGPARRMRTAQLG